MVTLEYIRSQRAERHTAARSARGSYAADRSSEYGGKIDQDHNHLDDDDVTDALHEVDDLVDQYA